MNDRENTNKGTQLRAYLSGLFLHDLPASLVVFLVAVPLSLGIAVASGAPVIAGLIAAVTGGIVVGALGGSPLQVSGPAAGLTVVVFETIHRFGWQATCAITIGAGVIQLILGALRVSRTALAISPAVVHGMLAGIGVVITLAQVHVIMGDSPESSAIKNLLALPRELQTIHGPATAIGLATLGILFFWKILPKSVQRIPAPLVAVASMTWLSQILNLDVPRVQLDSQLFVAPTMPRWPDASMEAVIGAMVTIGLIASVESLLSAVAVDRLHTGPRSNLDRELLGQGAANVLSGFLGGLPITGVIVRSSANVAAGAKTRASAILHGVWILLFVALLGSVIRQVPLAVLAGLLVFVGVQLINAHHIRELQRHGEVAIYFVTMIGVISLNLLEGVGLGIGLAFFLLLRRLAQTQITVEERDGLWHVVIEGSLTFLSIPTLNRHLSNVPAEARVDLDLHVDFMDHAAFEAIHTWRQTHKRLGGEVDIDETHEHWYSQAESGSPRMVRAPALAALADMVRGRRRRETGAASTGRDLKALVEGIQAFQRDGSPAVAPMLTRLADEGQEPIELFITCSDSRILPTLITGSGPGDLFQVRNVGNLVPPYTGSATDHPADTSIASAVEYALTVLGVSRIVVCGHSGCGAMGCLLNGSGGVALPVTVDWLKYGKPSLERLGTGSPVADGWNEVDRLALHNIIVQLEHLRTYPTVKERELNGQVALVGLFFDIRSAQVWMLNPSTRKFAPVTAHSNPAGPSRQVSGAAAH